MFQNDLKIKISTGSSRRSKTWLKQEMYWSDFVEKLEHPIRTEETLAEYMGYRKAKQDEIKDVGGFVGGELSGEQRRNENAGYRYLITLDADHIKPGGTDEVIGILENLGCSYVVYSTRKHEEAAPRLRIILPLDQPASPDEYEPIARRAAEYIGMGIFDPTTFETVRLMYWPSCSKDSQYRFCYADKPFLSKDGMLATYDNWRDITQWPEVPGAVKLRDRSIKKQGNPLEKKGIVGAFCKTYTVEQAMDAFLGGIYEPCDMHPGRYTYTEGSTVGGAVLYEDGLFLYSHHATDPAGGRLCNAFDLVRIHKFYELDYGSKEGTPITRLPSFSAMCEFAMEQPNVAKVITAERYERAQSEFSQDISKEDLDWMEKLSCSSQTGMPNKTIDNVLIILENDPNLKDRLYHDEFANRATVCRPMPWEFHPEFPYKDRAWTDEDDAGLRHYMEKTYGITGEKKILDGMAIYANRHKRHKIREYLTGLNWDGVRRLDTLLIDYFGAEDSEYVRAATRKTLCAAVARAMHPGCKFDYMLILSGAQGVGKSTFFSMLGKDWYSDSMSTFEGKDAAEMVQGYWIIEAGELTGFNRSEMNAVKQFLSKKEDVYRMPYGRRTANFPRNCIIVGTTNDKEFLKDRTGNRRFWPVGLGKQKPKKNIFQELPAEVDQVWAEAAARWMLGEPLYMSGDVAKVAQEKQETYREASPKEGVIREFLEKKIPTDWKEKSQAQRRSFFNSEFQVKDESSMVERDRICAAEVWCECFGGDLKQMRRQDTIEINGILNCIDGWQSISSVRFGPYGTQRGYTRVNRVLTD